MQEKQEARGEFGLSIIVPVYNEESGVGGTVERLGRVLDEADFPCEVVLVNDGSTDGTHAVLEGVSREGIRVLHQANRGYGGALKAGIGQARYGYVAITDADGTYPNGRIPEFFHQCESKGLDMVVGARTGENVSIPLARRPAKWVLNKLANYLSGTRIPDLNSGLRVMRKEVVERYGNILPEGFSFTTTITLAMLTGGYRVAFEPIDYLARKGKSKIRPIHDTLNFIQLIVRTVLYFEPLRVFLPASLLMLALSVAWGAFSYFALGKFADASTMLLFMTGIQLGALGLLADLIDRRLGGGQRRRGG